MTSIHIDQLKEYVAKVGATEAIVESIVSESAHSWAFYWRGVKATLSTPGYRSNVEVEVYVPELPEYIGYISYNDVTGRHFACLNKVVSTLKDMGMTVLTEQDTY